MSESDTPYVRSTAAARMLGVSRKTLDSYGLPYRQLRPQSHRYYRVADIRAWDEAQRRVTPRPRRIELTDPR